MKRLLLLMCLIGCVGLYGACSSSSTDSSDGGGGDSGGDDSGGGGDSGGGTTPTTAAEAATFGASLSDAIPAGLKSGSASANVAAMQKELSDQCAESYTNCPYMTAAGGGDSSTGEILMRLWALDYESACTAAYLADGTCFACTDCSGGHSNFIKPTMLAAPTSCATTSSMDARYVNFGVDPCFFDNMIGQLENFSECSAVTGAAVDISSAVPWYASWGIPQTIDFSGYQAHTEGGGMWWTINNGASANNQYFISLNSDWLYGGIKDYTNNVFFFFGSGSPSYYEGLGQGNGINISAYTGPATVTTQSFEAIQVRDQPPNTYIERMKGNATHVWYQSWSGEGYFPSTPADVDTVKNSPAENRCVEIGTSVSTSKYVPLGDCVASFAKASTDELNLDSNFTLKIIDGQTAGSIDFSTPLTSTSATSCLGTTAE